MNNSIGIIVPVYNCEKYLRECLNSIVNQDSLFDEIIIVDDGSTDGTSDIYLEYVNNYAQIRIIKQDNKGPAVARNIGLKNCVSDYICFLDSDDYLALNYVAKIKSKLKNLQVDAFFFDGYIKNELKIKKTKNPYDFRRGASQTIIDGRSFFKECFPDSYRVSPCMVVYRREYLKENHVSFPEEFKIYEDNYFSLVGMLEARRVLYFPEKLYYRRYREGSLMTSSTTFEKWKQLMACFEKCWDYLLNRYACEYDFCDVMLRYLLYTYRDVHTGTQRIVDIDDMERVRQALNVLQNKLAHIINQLSVNEMSCGTAKEIMHFQIKVDKISKELWEAFTEGKVNLIDTANKKIMSVMESNLKKLPLRSPGTVGIYGTGDHTRRLIAWYIKIFGIKAICAKMVFIETNCVSDRDVFWGFPIVNVKDIGRYSIDRIVISSVEYEDDMVKKLQTVNFTGEIIRFYENYENDFLPSIILAAIDDWLVINTNMRL